MGKLTAAQRQWIEGLGAAAPSAAPPGPAAAPPLSTAASSSDAPLAFSPFRDPPAQTAGPTTVSVLDLVHGPGAQKALRQVAAESLERDVKEAEAQIARMNQALGAAAAWITNLSQAELQKSNAAQVMVDVRKRFPEAAGIAQWVRQKGGGLPEDVRRRLPKPNALMKTVEGALDGRHAQALWVTKDLSQLAADRLLAAYMAELPSGVSVNVAGGVVQLSLDGAALQVQAAGADVEAKATKAGAEVTLKKDGLAITVENPGWKGFDPTVRAKWQSLQDETKRVLALKASGKQVEFEAEWAKLRERFSATATVSRDEIKATVDWLKSGSKDETLAKAGASAEVDLKELNGKLNAYLKTPTVEAALEATFAADKVTAKLELTAVKTGTVVTTQFEQSLEETKVAIEAMTKSGIGVSAELQKKADALSAKVKVVREKKDLKLAAEIEATLKEIRGTIRVEYQSGAVAVKASGTASSAGTGEAKAQIDIALKEGRVFQGGNEKLSFAASVSNQGWKFEAAFSLGEPVETSSVEELLKTADGQIKKLYELAGDKGIRSIADVKKINEEMQKVLEPIQNAANQAKTLERSNDIAVSFGFSIQGDWPAGGRASAPAGMFSVKIRF